MSDEQPLTERQVIREVALLERDDAAAAADLYRRAAAAGCAFPGLATSLMRLQSDPEELKARLAALDLTPH